MLLSTRPLLTTIALAGLAACGGLFRSGPDPVPFDVGDMPPGAGWFCSSNKDDSFCEREMLDCARKREVTPEAGACTEWKKPVFCYTFVAQSSKKHVDCLATKDHCESRAKAWRESGSTTVDPTHVSECKEVP